MKNVILTPNPYRDKGFQTVRRAMEILRDAGMEPKLCLPFEVDRTREFAPVKNATGTDSVESARELLKRNGVEL